MSQKLYCYVDETGQDTGGNIFVVASIVLESEKDELVKLLDKTEVSSGKQKRKWINTRERERMNYLDKTLTQKSLSNKIYFRVFTGSKNYEDLTVLVIAQAINLYKIQQDIGDYKATVVIDGLKSTEAHRVSKALRLLGISLRKVRGEKDESNSILRLADAVVGLVRESKETGKVYTQKLNQAKKSKSLVEILP